MARYLEQANECTDPVSGDYLWIYDASAGATDKDRKVNISKFAILANAQIFTAGQMYQVAAGSIAVNVITPASQSQPGVYLQPANCGTSYGPYLSIDRNNNASTPSAGWLRLVRRDGNSGDLWVDVSGNLRIGVNSAVSFSTDTGGTVVGAQTSYIGIKEDIVEWSEQQQALDAVLACKLFQYHLKGDETKRQYAGIVITDDDRGAWFSENDADNQIPALNERNLFGYLIGAIQAQQAQINALKAQVEELHANTRAS